MRLQVVTPLEVAVDADDVASLRAEDTTGAFGILPRHADFVTSLAISVVTWHDVAGAEHRIAVRGGVLRVQNGDFIQIATRQAWIEWCPTRTSQRPSPAGRCRPGSLKSRPAVAGSMQSGSD